MKSNLSLLFAFLIILTFTSCKKKQFLLDIKFGLTESQVKEEAIKLAKNKDLIMEVQNDDTSFYRYIDINGSTYKCRIYFNSDRLKTGTLRAYDYSLTTLPFAETGNDTVSKEGYKVTHWEVIKESDFENIKSYLDKKFGAGVFSTKKGNFGNDTIYKYVTEDADLFLTHGKKEDGVFWGIPLKVPFYTLAYIEIKSKTYESDFAKENEKKRKELKPEDVLWISFDAPSLDSDFDEFGNSVPKIYLQVNSETYATYVIDDDIIECKGILSITDAYEDTLKKAELIYKFSTPLTSPMKHQWRVMNYNAYSLKWTDPAFDKISNMIKSGSALKVHFTPTAIVLDDGSVIK